MVVFDRLSTAYRESYRFDLFPSKPSSTTLRHCTFFNQFERDATVSSRAMMVSEGIDVPESTIPSRRLKSMADSFPGQGPPRFEASSINWSRYAIPDTVYDLRDPASTAERYVTAGDLYRPLASHFFRKNGYWCAKGKKY